MKEMYHLTFRDQHGILSVWLFQHFSELRDAAENLKALHFKYKWGHVTGLDAFKEVAS